jgi:hypothetical protein
MKEGNSGFKPSLSDESTRTATSRIVRDIEGDESSDDERSLAAAGVLVKRKLTTKNPNDFANVAWDAWCTLLTWWGSAR